MDAEGREGRADAEGRPPVEGRIAVEGRFSDPVDADGRLGRGDGLVDASGRDPEGRAVDGREGRGVVDGRIRSEGRVDGRAVEPRSGPRSGRAIRGSSPRRGAVTWPGRPGRAGAAEPEPRVGTRGRAEASPPRAGVAVDGLRAVGRGDAVVPRPPRAGAERGVARGDPWTVGRSPRRSAVRRTAVRAPSLYVGVPRTSTEGWLTETARRPPPA